MRDPVDLVRLSYLAAAVFAVATGQAGHGLRFLLTFVAVLLPRALGAPRLFDFFFSASLGLQAWGNLIGLFGHGDVFDRLDHPLSPMGIAPLFYIWIVRLDLVPDLREEARRFHWLGILVLGFAVGLSVGALYEIYEYARNSVAGGHLFISESDTVLDLPMDAVGSLVGSGVLAVWASVGWGSRRLPREKVAEGLTPGWRAR